MMMIFAVLASFLVLYLFAGVVGKSATAEEKRRKKNKS